jgi:hypothetical protein
VERKEGRWLWWSGEERKGERGFIREWLGFCGGEGRERRGKKVVCTQPACRHEATYKFFNFQTSGKGSRYLTDNPDVLKGSEHNEFLHKL